VGNKKSKFKNMNKNTDELKFEEELELLAKEIQREIDAYRESDLTEWIKEEIKNFIIKWEA
jgi:lantibiotic modifying enzyme